MNSAYQDEMAMMSNFRYKLIENLQQLGDSNEKEEKELNKKIDELGEEIYKYLKLYFELLPFDFIMEQLSELGHCPNLLNDDNSHWAIVCDGYQNVVFGDEPQDIETHFYIEAKDWRDTPKKALEHYLFNNDK